MAKAWFSLYDEKKYSGNEEAFKELHLIQGINELECHYHLVYHELKKYLEKFSFNPQFNNRMVEIPKSWKVRSLRVWGVDMYDIQKHFPETMRLLNEIPCVVNIGFNLLEPQSKIKPHYGDTDAIYRCHLGLIIPNDYSQCAIKVNGIEKHWQEGKVLGFLDAYEHEAWNNSNEQRVILLFDILKPEFKDKSKEICATILSSFYLQRLGNIWKGIYKVKRKKFRYLMFPFIKVIMLLTPIRNVLRR